MSEAEQLRRAVAQVLADGATAPHIGVVLGSGLGAFGDGLAELRKIPYRAIPGMPEAAVLGHAGNLCLGRWADVPVACLQGRVHLYEGHPPERVVFGVRLLAELGCRGVLITNAAGGIREGLAPADLMLIVDHLNLTGRNPLVGASDDALGPRFPDMTRAYDARLCAAARRAAETAGVRLHEGVYAALLGPSYETPAEIRMMRTLGADAVGMSTVPEVIALRHRSVPVGAVSCITNLAAGVGDAPLDHAEVERVAALARDRFLAFLGRWVELADRELA
jgi:purine-nucleoside phosphorylase